MRKSTLVDIHDAKTNLSRLLDEVANGGEIVIAKAGKPVAKLVPLKRDVPRRKPGFMKGRIRIGDDFNSPLPRAVLASFEGK
jgi:prevent-host-death family protein